MMTERKITQIEVQPTVLEKLTRLDIALEKVTDEAERNRLQKEHSQYLNIVAGLTFSSYEEQGKYGVKLNDGQILEPAIYDEVRLEGCNEIVLARIGDEWIILYEFRCKVDFHISCEEICACKCVSEYLVRVNGLLGLYSTEKYDWLLQPEYDEIIRYGHEAVLKKGGKFGLWGAGFYVPARYDGLRFCNDCGYVGFYRDDVMGYIDREGQWTTDIRKAYVWAETWEDRKYIK